MLKELGIDFESRTKEIDESIPERFKKEKAAIYLSEKKAAAYKDELSENELLITSDTIVCLEDKILNKPQDQQEAEKMLKSLSNSVHEVITAVTLTSRKNQRSFSSSTKVFFKELDQEEIDYYWEKLSANPENEQCGWCKDKFGLSWQIVPENLGELMQKPDAYKTMMQQSKIVISEY